MASKTPLNAKNLETLGAARPAELLIEISTGSAVAKRRLRLELAGAHSPKDEWEAVGYGNGGATYAHQMEERARQSMVRMALKDIADAMGDVDAFIAQYDPKKRQVPKIAAEIAARLLAAGRAGDALGFIDRADIGKDRWVPREWQPEGRRFKSYSRNQFST